MSLHRFFCSALPLVAALSWINPASAAVYCATNAIDLQNMLNAAALSADDDVIRLRIGPFVAPGDVNGFTYVSGNDGALTISGNWFGSVALPNACVDQKEYHHVTTLSGNGERRALTVSMTSMAPGLLRIEQLRFADGLTGVSSIGGCASIVSAYGTVQVERVLFEGCLAPLGDGGGLFLQAKSAQLKGNLFHHNTARRGGAAFIDGRGGALVLNNNTIADNLAETLSGAAGGIQFVKSGIDGAATAVWASNNIIWGNNAGVDRYDIDVSGLSANAAVLRHNHLGAVKGTPAPSSSNTTSGDPRFVDATRTSYSDYAVNAISAAHNSGNNSPAGGLTTWDVAGAKRVQGPAVDRGAFEIDELFGNGFD
jgi:hypothetical protein